MHADATIYMGELAAGRKLTFATAPERHLFVYVTAGGLAVNDAALDVHDQGRITGEEELRFAAREAASFVVIDVPA
jgi:redox-sensitive bicupin YhaK (pirin superfamily)